MDYHKTGYKFLIWIMFVLYLICNTSLVDGKRNYRSYRSHRSHRSSSTYYYYSSRPHTLSTVGIVAVMFGGLITMVISCAGCAYICILIRNTCKKNTSDQVV